MNLKFKTENCYWRRQTFEYHPQIGWWHIPNMYARLPLGGEFHNFQTNSIGMRSSKEYLKNIPKNKKRILILGDSYTAGDGVCNDKRFSDILENRYPNLEVMNFGLNGSGTDQQLLIFETIAKDFDADAYIFCICIENIARNLCTCRPSFDFKEHSIIYRPKPYFTIYNDGLQLQNVPVPLEKRSADNLGDWQCSFPYLKEYPNDPYAIYHDANGPYWILMKKILERFMEQIHHKPIFILPMPMYTHYLGEAPPSYLPRFNELENLNKKRYILDVLPSMKAHPSRNNFRFPTDPHYTQSAHALLADFLDYSIKHYEPEILEASVTV